MSRLEARLGRLEAVAGAATVPTWAEASAASARIRDRVRGKVAAFCSGELLEPDPLVDVDEAIIARYNAARGLSPDPDARERVADQLARMAAREVTE